MAAVLAGCAAQPDHVAASQRLDNARDGITPPLGATTYDLDRQGLANQPGGDNRSLAQSLAQLPGVTVSLGGQVRVREQSFDTLALHRMRRFSLSGFRILPDTVLTPASLQAFHGAEVRRVRFKHDGREVEPGAVLGVER